MTSSPNFTTVAPLQVSLSGSNDAFVEEMCGGSAAIAGYRITDGTATYRHQIAGRGLIASYSLDRTGRHLIYSFDPSNNTGNGVVYIAVEGGAPDRRIMSDVFDISW